MKHVNSGPIKMEQCSEQAHSVDCLSMQCEGQVVCVRCNLVDLDHKLYFQSTDVYVEFECL